jgi:hypothetical protein
MSESRQNLIVAVLMVLLIGGVLLASVYNGVPVDPATNCDGNHGPCKGSVVDKMRKALGVQ